MNKQANTTNTARAKELSPEELQAKIALTGNLADLTPEQQMSYYARYCQHLGLDPITRPFDLLTTFEENGTQKTILYANASCSAQLADKREVSYTRPEMEHDKALGVLIVRVQAMMATASGNRSCWRSGVAHIEGLKGRRLENAIKKAETQAHRRATLALCGVAMPDESEIEDIGTALVVAPHPQAEFPTVKEVFDTPRPLPDTPLPQAWTEDSAARQIADQEIANKINAGLKTISDEIAAEAPAPLAAEDLDERAKQIAEAREKNIKAPVPVSIDPTHAREILVAEKKAREQDPVPALKPTLTPSQQKVSDAVMMLFKEHKRAKAETLLVIEKFLGRPVKASKDLTDEEAERVFAHLQAQAAELSENKPAPTKTKYNQKNRAHAKEVADAIDEAIKRLTVLRVPFGPLFDSMAELVEREFGRAITTRYELIDEEAQSVLEYLQTRILEKECEIAVKADEV